MKTLKTTAILFLTVALVGCASHQQIMSERLSQSANAFVGKNADDLLKAKGPPDATARLSSGEQLWTYRATQAGTRKGWTMTIGGGGKRHAPDYMTWRENTNFVIGADGLVKSFTVAVE
ncbi:MAG: hypothetical protein FJ398_11120 [Verrucomicrobia bacterium]|nr:hypothetical protein [Verrucomicrobiota bacterium]